MCTGSGKRNEKPGSHSLGEDAKLPMHRYTVSPTGTFSIRSIQGLSQNKLRSYTSDWESRHLATGYGLVFQVYMYFFALVAERTVTLLREVDRFNTSRGREREKENEEEEEEERKKEEKTF